MNWFDIIISLVLLGAFVRGFQKGLTMQLAGLVAIIIGAIFAGKAADVLLPFLLNTINISVNVARVISYILAFMIIVFGIRLIGKMLHSLFEVLHINFINKILGAILGIISGSIVLSILINLTVMIDTEEEMLTKDIKSETFFYSKIQVVVPTIVPYLRKEIWDKYVPDQIKKEDKEGEKIKDAPRTLQS